MEQSPNLPSAEELENYSLEEARNFLEERLYKLRSLEEQYEAQCQELFSLDRQINQYEALDGEFKFELECLASGDDSECKILEDELHSIEEENLKLDETHKNEITPYIDNLSIKNLEIQDIESQTRLLELAFLQNAEENEEDTLVSKQKTLVLLLGEIETIDNDYSREIHSNQILTNKIQEVEDELQCMQERLKYSTEKLQSTKTSVEELQAEVANIQADISSRKATSLDDASQGNSMFAEVYDCSLQLEAKLDYIKSHYNEMQSEHADMVYQIRMYTSDNEKLSKDLLIELECVKKHHESKIQRYLPLIEKDETLYAEKKKQSFEYEINIKTKDLPFGHPKFMTTSYNKTEAVLQYTLDEMINSREETVKITKQLADLKRGLRDKQAEYKKLSRELNVKGIQLQVAAKEKNVNTECKCKKYVVSSKSKLFAFAKCK